MSNKLPKGWVECKLGDLLYLQNGYAFKSNSYCKEGIPIIRISDISNDVVSLKDTIKINKVDIPDCYKIKNGDFLIAMSGATTGKTGIYINNEIAYLNQRVGNLKIYSKDVLFPRYRDYFIANKRREIEKKAYGGAQPNISKDMIESLIFLLPPLNEQKRIVEKIEKEFENIDKGIEYLSKTKEQIKQYRQSVLKSAFEGRLSETTDWEEKSLIEISEKITDGSHFSPKTTGNGIFPYITVKDVLNDKINFKQCKHISLQDYNELVKNGCQPIKNDVLFSKDGTVGKVVLIDFEQKFVILSSLAIIRPKINIIYPAFLKYALKNPQFIQMALNKKTGVAIRRIILQTLKKMKISFPKEVSIQKKIVQEIEKRFKIADEIEKIVDDNLEKAKQLKQSILKKAFEGRLVPQDPADEPASKLLERIKLEKRINNV